MKNKIIKILIAQTKIFYYKFRGKRPLSVGYAYFRSEYIKKIINNQGIMKKFKDFEFLSKGYGWALDERVIEYPWALSRISESEEGYLLDVGSTLNVQEILEYENLKNKKITILNLNPESNCFWQKGISYIFEDARSLPFKDNYFDYITCISALEHIGMDNTLYIKDLKYNEKKTFDFEKTVLELKRALKKDGKLLITVPFGKYHNFGWFQQFDSRLINRILETFQPENYQINYYKYTKEGWNISNEISCQNCEYFDFHKTKYFNKRSSLGFDTDFAVASRAVACLELIKK